MNSDRLGRIEQLFEQALALPEAARHAFLVDQCGGDDELRHEVASLLAHHTDEFLETPEHMLFG